MNKQKIDEMGQEVSDTIYKMSVKYDKEELALVVMTMFMECGIAYQIENGVPAPMVYQACVDAINEAVEKSGCSGSEVKH